MPKYYIILAFLAILLVSIYSALAAITEQQLNSQVPGLAATPEGKVYEIVLVGVTERGDACGISVNGIVGWIDVDQEGIINGLEIKVLRAFPIRDQFKDKDVCQVFLYGISDYTPKPPLEIEEEEPEEVIEDEEMEEPEEIVEEEQIIEEEVLPTLYQAVCRGGEYITKYHFGECQSVNCGKNLMSECREKRFLWFFKRHAEVCEKEQVTECSENPVCAEGYTKASRSECLIS